MNIRGLCRKAVILCMWLVCGSLIVAGVMHAEGAGGTAATAFRFEAADAEAESEVRIDIYADHAVDVYAYEAELVYNPNQLKLIRTESGLSGFSVSPIAAGDRLRLAHTQLGKIPGASGKVKLASVVFERLHRGDATIHLNEIKLVAADLSMTIYRPGHLLKVADSTANIRLLDIGGHWAETAIREAVEHGFVNGYEDDAFRPQREVTRAEFTVMLARALQLGMSTGTAGQEFADEGQLPDWARGYLYAAVQAGLLEGYEDGAFRPNRPITRAEMTVIASRSIELSADNSGLSYADADLIPDWAYESVVTATAAGIVEGREDRLFAPLELSSRAEAVVLILNLLNVR